MFVQAPKDVPGIFATGDNVPLYAAVLFRFVVVSNFTSTSLFT
jgi:hypothetical protein